MIDGPLLSVAVGGLVLIPTCVLRFGAGRPVACAIPSFSSPFFRSPDPDNQSGLDDGAAWESDATIQSQLGGTQAAALISVSLIVVRPD